MADFYLTEQGDIAVSPAGDIAITPTPWREYSQQAYTRVMTYPGDYLMYPNLGTNLEQLIGMPQSPSTGELGKEIIMSSLRADPKFTGVPITVNAVPTGYQSIRFDIYITAGSRTELLLSIEQNLGFD